MRLPTGRPWPSIGVAFWSARYWAGPFLPLVLTGLHQGMVPIHVELVQAHGYNALLPILAMAGVGQVGAHWRYC